jgi:murein DD-endopeptidase MepM/ murein hydrolase activator NlpD
MKLLCPPLYWRWRRSSKNALQKGIAISAPYSSKTPVFAWKPGRFSVFLRFFRPGWPYGVKVHA